MHFIDTRHVSAMELIINIFYHTALPLAPSVGCVWGEHAAGEQVAGEVAHRHTPPTRSYTLTPPRCTAVHTVVRQSDSGTSR